MEIGCRNIKTVPRAYMGVVAYLGVVMALVHCRVSAQEIVVLLAVRIPHMHSASFMDDHWHW